MRADARLGLTALGLSYFGLTAALPLVSILVVTAKFGFNSFVESLTTPVALHALWLTFYVALAVTLIHCFLGSIAAMALDRYQFPGKKLVDSVIDLPFAIPTVVTGFILVITYGPRSIIGAMLRQAGVEIIYAVPGIILATAVVSFPFVIRSVQAGLALVDRGAVDAAKMLGATDFQILRFITFPTVAPSLAAGASLCFARSVAEFGAVIILAGNIPLSTQTAAVYVFAELESYNLAGAVSMSTILVALSLATLLIVHKLGSRG